MKVHLLEPQSFHPHIPQHQSLCTPNFFQNQLCIDQVQFWICCNLFLKSNVIHKAKPWMKQFKIKDYTNEITNLSTAAWDCFLETLLFQISFERWCFLKVWERWEPREVMLVVNISFTMSPVENRRERKRNISNIKYILVNTLTY